MRNLVTLSVIAIALGWIVLVSGCPPTVVPIGPTAHFSADVVSGPVPLLVHFTSTSVPGTSPITSYHWEFGDGASTTSTSPDPTWNYSETGDYTVSLTVTTDVGSHTLTRQDYITVAWVIL